MIRLYTLAALTFLFGLLPTSVPAQQLTTTASLITGHIPHDKLTGMKNTTRTLIRLLQENLTSDAPAPIWHGEYIAGRSSSHSLLSFGAQCSYYSSGTSTGSGKTAELLLLANDLSPLLGHYIVNGKEYGTIKATITHRNGGLYFELPHPEPSEPTEPSGQPGPLSTSFWLIAADSNRLPYTPITRREYLLEIRQQLISDTLNIVTEWRKKIIVRPAAQQEAEKQRELQQLKTLYAGADLAARTNIYLQNFTTDEAYLGQYLNTATFLQRTALRLIDSLLHTSAADLNRPAYLREQAPLFHGFANNLPGALLLVKLNPASTNPYLSEEIPQFFLLGWRFDPADPLAADLDRRLHDNLDGGKLREMLGK